MLLCYSGYTELLITIFLPTDVRFDYKLSLYRVGHFQIRGCQLVTGTQLVGGVVILNYDVLTR